MSEPAIGFEQLRDGLVDFVHLFLSNCLERFFARARRHIRFHGHGFSSYIDK
jgi:hypothetical protein